jgi:hypothetical protein
MKNYLQCCRQSVAHLESITYYAFSMRFIISLSLLLLTACASSLAPIPDAWRTIPQAPRITDLCARVTCADKPKAPEVHISAGKLYNGEKALTPEFAAIQSFDVSLDRREIVFSAKRGDSFDVGLVSLDGSDVHWIPSERVDETDVQWAPRGNKVSYIVHAPGGDVVRTVHIPTSAQLSADFQHAQVDALAWDPPAERYAVIVESPEASQRVESVKYSGEGRQTIVPAGQRLDVAIEPLAGALVLRPSAMRYNETLPLVVWPDPQPLRWNDERAALMRNARVALAIVSKPPDATFWNEVGKTKWIDAKRMYAVNAGRRTQDSGLSIIEDPGIPAGFYRVDGHAVRVRKVQSFAAGYIAHELNTNGR